MPNLYLDELFANPNAVVIIDTPNGTIKAFITDDIQVGISAEYNSPFQLEATESFNQFIKKWSGGNVNVSMKSAAQTVKSWVNSTSPTFTFNLAIPSYNDKTKDIRKQVGLLYGCVLPTFSNDFKVYPPNNYKATLDDWKNPDGTVTISVGDWFMAKKQIITEVTFTYSAIVNNYGFPMYAEGSITFCPYRDYDLNDFGEMFPGADISSSTSRNFKGQESQEGGWKDNGDGSFSR
jgi:hypothetical protein